MPGANVSLTIDRDVQWVAQRAIAEQVRRTKSRSGDVVVLDVKTGELVALATAPTYDPNRPTGSPAANRVNRPLQEMYEPGSVAKVLTAAALVDGGYVTPRTKIKVPAGLTRDGHADRRLLGPRHDQPDVRGCPGEVQQHRHDPRRRTDAEGRAGALPARVRARPADRHRARRARRTGSARAGRTTGRICGGRRSRSARAWRSTPSRWPPRSRRSPTAGSASSRASSGAGRRPRAACGSRLQRRSGPGSSASEAATSVAADDGTGRRRRGGAGHEGADPGLPRRRQDRHRAAGRPGLWLLPRLHGVVRRVRTGRPAALCRLCRRSRTRRWAATAEVASPHLSSATSWRSPCRSTACRPRAPPRPSMPLTW